MIVLGADMHKRSHTVAAIAATTGEVLGDKTIPVGDAGFIALLDWARGFGVGGRGLPARVELLRAVSPG
jgi:hypothetical protein